MSVEETNVGRNRYPGVKPFRQNEQALFFGRDTDVEHLYGLLYVKQAVVLYGKSGYGKSSLISAGIIPKLDKEDTCIYFSIRFNNFSERADKENLSPVQNVRFRIYEKRQIDKVSLFDDFMPDEDSFWLLLKKHQHQSKRSQFIFFFDQFEELFTYPKEQIDEFSDQLSQLLYGGIPVRIRKRMAELDEAGELDDDLHNFLYEKIEVKVMYAVRSDRLSQLNGLSNRHPTILQNCYELDALKPEQARRAIVEPALVNGPLLFATPVFSYTSDALEKILSNIANQQDGKIEAAALQIICRHVEIELVGERKNIEITSALLGNISSIMEEYYESTINKLEAEDRQKARLLLEEELLEGGRRNALSANYIQTKFKIEDELLLQLEASSLLRKERDAAGRVLIELSHDALIVPISEAKEKRLKAEREERQRLEREKRRKQDEGLNLLRQARELRRVDKEAIRLNHTADLKRKKKVLVRVLAEELQHADFRTVWLPILFLLTVAFSMVWSIIATYKFIHRNHIIKENARQLEDANKNFEKYIITYDSVRQPMEYHQLKNILKEYQHSQEP